MANPTLQNITGANPDEIHGIRNASIRSYDADASNRDDASASVETDAAAAITSPTRSSSSNAKETPIVSLDSLSSARNLNPASNDEQLLAAFTKVVRSVEAIHASIAALGAELESFRTIERQSSAEAGPQTSAGGDGGAPNALGTSPQGPEQCVHCGGPLNQGRIAQGAEIGQKARGYGKYVGILCILVAIFYLLVCKLGTDLKDAQWSISSLSAVPEPLKFNGNITFEAIVAFCQEEEECVNKVSSYCARKHFIEKKGLYAKRRLELKEEEDEIIAKYM